MVFAASHNSMATAVEAGKRLTSHVVCLLGAIGMLEAVIDIRRWLDGHSHEVLVLFIQDAVGAAVTERVVRQSGPLGLTYRHKAGALWPTLPELIESDRRVVVMAENNGVADTWYQPAFDVTQDTPFLIRSLSDLAGFASCRLSRGRPENPLFLLNHWVSDFPPSKRVARIANDERLLLARVRVCEAFRDRRVNFIAVDFVGSGDLFAVVERLNGVDV